MTNIPMFLELTHEDADVLKRALNIRLNELRIELAGTDDRSYRTDLRHELDRLENIDRELEGLAKQKQSA